jgi:crotonobetainyl-CoA:carnitine CoA-transferase CaiB-like acyl-CoA transferase
MTVAASFATPTALAGIRVIDMTDKSCVYATKVLADMGADVIRVEPTSGDPMRAVEPLDPSSGRSLFHAYMNANKRTVALNLDSEAGIEAFKKLVGSASIVVESARPGQLAAKGIGYEDLAAGHRALVWTSVTPFGSKGPYATWQADDLVSQAMGGLMALSGLPDREPLRLYGEQSCYIAGLHAASGTLIALWQSLISGEGQHCDVSVQACIAHTLENAVQLFACEGVVRGRQVRSVEAGIGIFPCTDGEIFVYATVGMIASSWDNLVRWMQEEGIPDAAGFEHPKWREQSWRRTDEGRQQAAAAIAQLTKTRAKYQVYDQMQQRHILCAPMSQVGDLFNNPQLKFLSWFQPLTLDDRISVWPGAPFRMSETPRLPPTRIPGHGEHSTEVLRELGFPERSLEAFAKAGVI